MVCVSLGRGSRVNGLLCQPRKGGRVNGLCQPRKGEQGEWSVSA